MRGLQTPTQIAFTRCPETEDLFRLQLQELEQGRNDLIDLDLAYKFQLREALEASRLLSSQSVTSGSKKSRAPLAVDSVVDLTAEQADVDLAARRDLVETQVWKGLFGNVLYALLA